MKYIASGIFGLHNLLILLGIVHQPSAEWKEAVSRQLRKNRDTIKHAEQYFK